MKEVTYVAVFIGGVVVCYLLTLMGVIDFPGGVLRTESLEGPLSTYLGLVSVMMTAITAVLAAVAIGIGIVAAYTFREIKSEALRSADNRVEELVSERLSERAIRSRIDEIAFRQESRGELDQNFDPDDAGER